MCTCDIEATELLGGLPHGKPVYCKVSYGAQTTLDLLAILKLFRIYLPDLSWEKRYWEQ